MSGGVDSAVAAFVLQSQGYDVCGVFMKNWDDMTSDPSYRKQRVNDCPWEEDAEQVRLVCERLDIPFTIYHFEREYYDRVFSYFLSELRVGRTPNPDVLCNQEIKFQLFFERAIREESADAIATGHYAKIENGMLVRPKDREKDQTYFLSRIDARLLPHVLFPLHDMLKSEVRAIAREQHFPNADKKDSTGICFIGNIQYPDFVKEFMKLVPGEIRTLDEAIIGTHRGLPLYTIGQRKGIEIGGTGPYYVVRKDNQTNCLYVTHNPSDPALFSSSCVVRDLHWFRDPVFPTECDIQIRYRQSPQRAQLTAVDTEEVRIDFFEPQRAVTPGQFAACYDGDVLLGSGKIITTA